ncbi:MAG: flagellar biosynthesis protein FlhB [Deltaproteobacteria bacterium]|nr:flagellar biosynthesis protein FlhB [Deltaproteobacteria bacterium]
MAEQGGTSQEKTEDATPKRLREARKKGQVSKSRDLNTIVILIAAFGLLWAMISFWSSELHQLMFDSFTLAARKDLTNQDLLQHIVYVFVNYFRMVSPFLLAIAGIALAVGFLQVGPLFSAEPLLPQMKRLNIIENFKNMFKMTTFIELIKNIVKVTLIFLMAYLVLADSIRDIVLTTNATLEQSMKLAGKITSEFLIRVFLVFIAVALIDFFVQRWQYHKQMRMTKDEVKREYKQDEGDPLIKSQRRQLHQELAMSDTKKAVQAADVVITNPTELAIAVKYDDKEMAAPTVMAKGQRLFAQTIREYAEEFQIPIVRNVPLAWTLIELDIGDEIPEELYATVAEVLVYVYKLKESNAQSDERS